MHTINFIAKNSQYQINQTNKGTKERREKQTSRVMSSRLSCKKIAVNTFSQLLCLACLGLFFCATGYAQQSTKNTPDQMLRSNGRVNPSSLGMEMDIPLGNYPARGINLPLGLSYSSKLWRFQEHMSISQNNGTSNVYVYPRYSENAAAGWTTSLSQAFIEYTGQTNLFDDYGRPLQELYSQGQQTPPGENYIRRITVYLPGGGSHELVAQHEPIAVPTLGQGAPASAWEGTFYATDGSGLKYVQDSANNNFTLWLPDGSFYTLNPGTTESKGSNDPTPVRRAKKLTDAHGNYTEFKLPDPNNSAEMLNYPYGYWTDTLGRKFPVMIPRETPTMPSNIEVLTKSFTLPGMSQPYVLRWKRLQGTSAATSALTPNQNYVLKYAGHTTTGSSPTSYGPTLFYDWRQMSPCSGDRLKVVESEGALFNPVVLAEIELPNGAKYRFTYNEYGEIDRIHYPTGGYEVIQYAAVASLAELATPYQMSNRGVSSRAIFESESDSTADTWTYTAQKSANNFRTSTIAPDETRTDRFMHRGAPEPDCGLQNTAGNSQNFYGTRWGYDNALAGMPYEERSFDSNGVLKQRTITRWTATDTTTALTLIPARYVQRNARTLSTETIVYEGASTGLSSVTTMVYDTDADNLGSPLNVTKTTQYAFKQSAWDNSITPGQSPPAAVSAPSLPSGISAVKSTETTYLSNTTYRDRNLIKLPLEIIIRDGQDNPKSKSSMQYDQTSLLESASISNAPGWTNLETSARGLVTTTTVWTDIDNGQTFQTYIEYDQFGNIRRNFDGNGNKTEIIYTDNFSGVGNLNTYAFPTKIISPEVSGVNTSLITITKYEYETGLTTVVTDPNGLETRMEYNDPLRRPTKKSNYYLYQAVGSVAETIYGTPDSSGQFPANQRFVKSRAQIDEDNWKEDYTWTDGLNRVIKTQSVNTLSGDVFVINEYDNMGRVVKTSNPFRNVTNPVCGTNIDCTTMTYDAAGRGWKVKTADNAETERSYSLATTGNQIGTVMTVDDQADKQRRSITDALGQLIRVDEPTAGGLGAIDSPNQPTVYTYDSLNNLVQVQQNGSGAEQCGAGVTTCSQTRSFEYDSLSRLKKSTTPESGVIQYGYDNNGNMTTKLSALGITTTYVFDALDRIKTRSYTGETGYQTPPVNYFYDNLPHAKGKLTKVVTGADQQNPFSVTEYTEFDSLGRVTKSKQKTDNLNIDEMTYTYNLSSTLIEQKYPSGRVVKNILDNEGELFTVQSRKNQNTGYWNYAQHFTYTAAGEISSMQFGNGRWESTEFNNRLQPTQIALGSTQNATDQLKLNFNYGTTDNNGNVLSQVITVPTETRGNQTYGAFTATQTYTYDVLNRLKQATETIPGQTGWQQTFVYDRYGNRSFDESSASGSYLTTTLNRGCSQSSYNPNGICDKKASNPTFTSDNNRIKQDQDGDTQNDYLFDSAGNTTKDASGNIFIYDGDNKQVEVKNSSNQTIGQYWYDGAGRRVKKYVPSTGETTIFVYDASGKMVGEYSTIVASQSQAKVSYLTNDHLNSPRINTDADGNVTARHDYQPFGEEIIRTGYGDDSVRKKFTAYERDKETNLDFAQARMYANKLGRFSTPDPLLTTGKLFDAQTWNRYAYVLNNPLTYIDPTGLYEFSKALGGSASDAQLRQNAKTDAEKKEVERIIGLREQFRKALAEAKKASTDPKLTAKERARLTRAVKAYGTENVSNREVKIEIDKKDGAQTDGRNPNGDIMVYLSQNETGDLMTLNVAHEGSHVADWQYFNAVTEKTSPLGGPTLYETEKAAYGVSMALAKSLGRSDWQYTTLTGGQVQLWDKSLDSLKESAREAFRERDIDQIIAAGYKANGKPLTQNNPGDTFGKRRRDTFPPPAPKK